MILNNNSFQFNNINYSQTLGTAMGTKMSSTYTILTLAYLAENLNEIIGKKYGYNIKKENLLRHGKIKFTMEHSSKELPFLDILIKKENGQIISYLPQTHRHLTILLFQ